LRNFYELYLSGNNQRINNEQMDGMAKP